MTRIKFCGLQTLDDIKTANETRFKSGGTTVAIDVTNAQTLLPRTKRLEVGS